MKGESKQTCHFKPIETKASAQSRPHVLSSHPGFDSSLTFGAITISFQHSMKNKEQDSTSEQTVENEKIVKETVHGVVENLFKEAEVEKDLEALSRTRRVVFVKKRYKNSHRTMTRFFKIKSIFKTLDLAEKCIEMRFL